MKIFTVIGNVLFCHIKITKKVLKTEPIVEIPPAIYARMLFTTQKFTQVNNYIGINSTYAIDVGVNKLNDKKYFLFCKMDIYEVGTYLVGYYILKDI